MEILMAALWRGIFMGNEAIKEPHVRVMAEYMDRELADVYEIDAVRRSHLFMCRYRVCCCLNRLTRALISSVLVRFQYLSWELRASEGLMIMQMSFSFGV